MELTLGVSPSAQIVVRRYDPAVFPKFRSIFDDSKSEGPLRSLVREPEEANTAVVMQNRSDKDITGLRYYWVITDEDGSEKRRTVSADSYMVDVYRPVLGRGDSKLIRWSTTIDESVLDHVLRGGGVARTFCSPHFNPLNLLAFEIEFVLFTDGEIAGQDRDRYAAELQCRKPAAEFVLKQIRLAESEGRDVTPVLAAIAEMPHIGNLWYGEGDPLVHWVQEYARDYLRSVSTAEAKLRHLENRPVLPKFYRRRSD